MASNSGEGAAPAVFKFNQIDWDDPSKSSQPGKGPPEELVAKAKKSGAVRKKVVRGEGGFFMNRSSLPPGFRIPPHTHNHDELIVILKGGCELDGGLGLGMVEAVVVFAELGRRLAPGPTVWTHMAAELIEGASEGDVVVGGIDCTRSAAGPHLVESLESLDVLLVLTEDGVGRIPADQLEDFEYTEDARSTFSLQYFSSLIKAIEQNTPVHLHLGNEYPLRLSFQYAEGKGSATYLLAPRIEGD